MNPTLKQARHKHRRSDLPCLRALAAAFILCLLTPGCDQLQIPDFSKKNPIPLAEQSAATGDYPAAVRFYESALDGTSGTAELHYRLGVLYERNLNDPVSALHHFRRYRRMSEGTRGRIDVDPLISRIERDLAARMGEGGLVTRSEAIRLRNENNELRREISQLRQQRPSATAARTATTTTDSQVPEARRAEPVDASEPRTYTVQRGDTLAAISRKFYNTSERWKDIADANHNQLDGTTNIREGQILIIP